MKAIEILKDDGLHIGPRRLKKGDVLVVGVDIDEASARELCASGPMKVPGRRQPIERKARAKEVAPGA